MIWRKLKMFSQQVAEKWMPFNGLRPKCCCKTYICDCLLVINGVFASLSKPFLSCWSSLLLSCQALLLSLTAAKTEVKSCRWLVMTRWLGSTALDLERASPSNHARVLQEPFCRGWRPASSGKSKSNSLQPFQLDFFLTLGKLLAMLALQVLSKTVTLCS